MIRNRSPSCHPHLSRRPGRQVFHEALERTKTGRLSDDTAVEADVHLHHISRVSFILGWHRFTYHLRLAIATFSKQSVKRRLQVLEEGLWREASSLTVELEVVGVEPATVS
jgi:hypothetical protein